MRTTLDIEPALLDKVVRATGEKTKSNAVNRALEEYLRRLAYEELRAIAGTMDFDHEWDVWRRTMSVQSTDEGG